MNLHLEHPEDSILTGDLSVLDAFLNDNHISVKMDGSPAIVWGTHPETSKFFVGTKSVFNKKDIKVNYTHDDIDRNHKGFVGVVLHACLSNLPKTNNIYQGDFLGFGGDNVYQPNTVTYVFRNEIEQTIVVAPHTQYPVDLIDDEITGNVLRCLSAVPLNTKLTSSLETRFIQPLAKCKLTEEIENKIQFAKTIASTINFIDNQKEANALKKELNCKIRFSLPILPEIFKDYNPNLIGYWLLIKQIKEMILEECTHNMFKAYINGVRSHHGEGYVIDGAFGTFKLVSREEFSCANFERHR